ncbi:MAG: 50S ribosomal protein L32 [Cyanobacteria bacterium NC_groundwater_1444_Ag_S-0.65um_54_12]|nr:50S ribosomal protein L32 [Cyanobacteria bacterium NC_groundwater_1444_Ag_S-0.65um_54_12]
MAQPKKKTSNSKQWHRRSHWKAKVPNLATCPRCHAKVLPHTLCLACGHYRGLKILEVASE